MLSRNKTTKYIGIPVGLALLAGGFWLSTPVSRAGDATEAYDADSHTGIWVPPGGSSIDITRPPWGDSWNRPGNDWQAGSLKPTTMQQERALMDSDRAQTATIEKLRKDGIGFLTAAALQEKMKSSWHGIVVDVGAKSAYMHEHILGAINIPENQVSTLAPIVLPDLKVPIVTYCGSTECSASMSAAKQFKALGYAEVYDFWGGLKAWVAMGLPTREREVAGK
ncbi:MAG: rhodanese-like domain-containing protein [Candidatus Brocadiia bacterium]|jgi:rhodanese-related sulfurtransferase